MMLSILAGRNSRQCTLPHNSINQSLTGRFCAYVREMLVGKKRGKSMQCTLCPGKLRPSPRKAPHHRHLVIGKGHYM